MIETPIEAVANELAEVRNVIRETELEYDAQIRAHHAAIANLRIECAERLVEAGRRMSELERELERYAAANLPDDSKTIRVGNAVLSFRKQPPLFMFKGAPLQTNDAAFIDMCRRIAPQSIKTTQTVDWADLKRKLSVEGDNVYFTDTGEVIDGLHAQLRPDKFTVMT